MARADPFFCRGLRPMAPVAVEVIKTCIAWIAFYDNGFCDLCCHLSQLWIEITAQLNHVNILWNGSRKIFYRCNQHRGNDTLFYSMETRIGCGLLKTINGHGPLCIITDEVVDPLYGKALRDRLNCAMITVSPAGECSKSRETKALIENELLRLGFGSDVCLIALGGGVICDMTGFVAATYCRGVKLVLIPTTLLAMCDAAIGGKNGVNICTKKNAIGTIYPPHALYIDPDVCSTLEQTDYISGTAEILKHGLVWDRKLWDFMLENVVQWRWRKPDFLQKIIEWNMKVKTDIIKAKKRDLVNFGHTVGHALEMLKGLSHGHAVAKGMWLETLWSCGYNQEIFDGLTLFGLDLDLKDIDPEKLWQIMQLDKKKQNNTLYAVYLDKIGQSSGTKPMEYDDILPHLSCQA